MASVFKIVNGEGKNIGNHDYYTKLSSAKNAAHNCLWSFTEGSKIVELELVEKPISETLILIEFGPDGENGYRSRKLSGFKSEEQKIDKPKSIPTGIWD